MTLTTEWMKRILARKIVWMIIQKKYGIDKLPQGGPDYLCFLLSKIKNPFWISFIKAITKFKEIFDMNNPQIFALNEPLWFNPLTKLEHIKKWDVVGLRTVKDHINSSIEIKTQEEILSDFHISLNSIDYARMIKAIPTNWSIEKDNWEINTQTS